MERKIRIAIMDTNRFFVEGLKFALLEYFSLRGTNVEFQEGVNNGSSVDLVLNSLTEPENVAYCDTAQPEVGFRPLYISVRKKKHTQARRKNACAREVGVLDSQASIKTLFHLLDEKLWRKTYVNMMPQPCQFCLGRQLSSRETEVISYLRLGLNQTQTAKFMHLSVKTVHSHKRSVMQKLNFMRRSELYSWLLRI
ncbi:transcriptional regulator, LuxR family [Serratia sp. AS12]|uniref:response regulator transcription factor n=1 Tax=Serratia TaxID=613 RepID=UPI00020EA213|nr:MULTISPECIES: LuxR C-terminal-related transcriptional regulator [Serratia]AEF47902.1 transcriptional regulator, LuxR family [Serratia plymuthica AS9]AEF52854.1 transcriptional regulator, LuxR family [Serratia sp. AS12]AEG30561.1 transcriptional regulator, LuxR family [Serratia sp. AS13]UTN96543.1 LuxR C-terminal-related transcriptional regulator [Serratia plymuthica]